MTSGLASARVRSIGREVNKMQKQKKGFTLIELLVVIAIIGILSAIGLVSLNGAREKARDSKRQSDLSSVKSAIALYYDDNNSLYPATNDSSSTGGAWASLATALVPTYSGALPLSATAGATTGNKGYWYIVSSDRVHYLLYTQLEGTVSGTATPFWYTNDRGVSATAATAAAANVCNAGVGGSCP